MPRLSAVVCAVPVLLFQVAVLDAQSPADQAQSANVIRVDSLVREAPVSTLAELLNARVPGLHVSQSQSGVVGDVRVRIRASNSIAVSGSPLVIVDGARYTSATWPEPFAGGATGARPTHPLDDLDPSDVETVQVLKGPAAAALYGLDAANGVILITTKQGQPGRPRWNIYGRRMTADMPSRRPVDSYWGWGSSGGTPVDFNCTLAAVAASICTQDSVTVTAASPDAGLARGAGGWTYGGNVAGGSDAVRYYLGANVDDDSDFADASPPVGDGRTVEQGLSRVNLRANLATRLGTLADVQANAGYVDGSADGFDRSTFDSESGEQIRRFVGSVTGSLRPTTWLQARATLGYDRGRRTRTTLVRRDVANPTFPGGAAGLDSALQKATRVEVAATATARSGRISTRSTIGVEYARQEMDVIATFGTDLPPNGTSAGEASTIQMRRERRETVVRGLYVDETLGLNDRLFVTGGVRVDRVETFGHEYDAAVYPRASVSWLLSDEPWMPRLDALGRLRLRYAFGVAGQYPAGSPGSSRPERVSEHEIGLQADALGNRLELALTRYSRRTNDQLLAMPLPPGLGSIYTNIGESSQHGFEAQVTARVVETRSVSWSVSLQHASHKTNVDDLGPAIPLYSHTNGYAEGYPVGARFFRPITGYGDANANGIIEPGEVQLSDTYVYAGESEPSRSQVVATTVGLLDRRLRLFAMLERRSGYTRIDELRTAQCFSGQCRGAVDPAASFGEQAEAVAVRGGAGYAFIESGDFTRLREFSAALELPGSLARAVKARSATLTLAGRNLALWSDFGGGDPEVSDGVRQGRSWMLRMDLDF